MRLTRIMNRKSPITWAETWDWSESSITILEGWLISMLISQAQFPSQWMFHQKQIQVGVSNPMEKPARRELDPGNWSNEDFFRIDSAHFHCGIRMSILVPEAKDLMILCNSSYVSYNVFEAFCFCLILKVSIEITFFDKIVIVILCDYGNLLESNRLLLLKIFKFEVCNNKCWVVLYSFIYLLGFYLVGCFSPFKWY